MSGRIGQPVGQVRLTNVAIIRMKKNGKRFEIAAYKNKVVNWRSGVEKDLNEVLQTTTVFTNVSKGIFANKKDLEEAFGTDDYEKAAVFILNHGEIEIGEKERQAMFEAVFRDVATIIAEKCVNPDTQRPYTLSLIEKALKDAHFAVVPSKSAKQQALKAVQVLQTSGFQIERARMRVRLTVPIEAASDVQGYLKSVHAEIESTAAGASAPSAEASGAAAPEPPLWTTSAGGALAVFDAIVDPGCYRGLEERVGRLGAGSGAALEVLSLAATAASGGAGSERRRAAAGAGGGDADSEDDEEAEADGPLPASSARAERHKGAESDPEDDDEHAKVGAKHAGASTAAHKPAAAAAPVAAAPAAAAPTRAAYSSDETAAAARGTGMLVSRVTQPGARLSCATCSATFDGPEGHRAHFRSDFHRYNLKRKMRAQPGIPEEAFKALTPKEVAAMLEALE